MKPQQKSEQKQARRSLGETSDEYARNSPEPNHLREETAGEEAQRNFTDVANTAPGGMGERGPRIDRGFADDSVRRDR